MKAKESLTRSVLSYQFKSIWKITARHFKISRTMVRQWQDNKEKIFYYDQGNAKKIGSGRAIQSIELENFLSEFIKLKEKLTKELLPYA